MTLAIDLHHDLASMTDEVGNVAAHRRLPPETGAIKAMRFQMTPKQLFGPRHDAPHLPGAPSLT